MLHLQLLYTVNSACMMHVIPVSIRVHLSLPSIVSKPLNQLLSHRSWMVAYGVMFTNRHQRYWKNSNAFTPIRMPNISGL